ncbi:MAG: hypothetical protein VKK62_11685 [Synechococcaceae cyanobacterium]|nr:hypothetical protein [Synechococcaceae cyanobacterium]
MAAAPSTSTVENLVSNARDTRLRVRPSLALCRSVLATQLLRLPPERVEDRAAVAAEMRRLDRALEVLAAQEAA